MFSEGREDVNDEERAGRPSTSTTDEKIDEVEKMILANRRITVREVAEDLNISIGLCHSIFINDLGMRRVAAKFVPKLLNCDQKQHRMNIANEMLDSVRDDPNLLQRVITGDEAWEIEKKFLVPFLQERPRQRVSTKISIGKTYQRCSAGTPTKTNTDVFLHVVQAMIIMNTTCLHSAVRPRVARAPECFASGGRKVSRMATNFIRAESPSKAEQKPVRHGSLAQPCAELSANQDLQNEIPIVLRKNQNYVNPPAGGQDANSAAPVDLAAIPTSNAAAQVRRNWADITEEVNPGAEEGFTLVQGRKRRRGSGNSPTAATPSSNAGASRTIRRPQSSAGSVPRAQEIRATRAHIADARARQASSSEEHCVYIEHSPELEPFHYLRALDRKLGGTAGVIQITKVNGHQLLGLTNRGLAERLISEGLEVEGTLLRAFPFRKRAERITVGNLPFFVADSAVITALSPFGRVTSIAPKQMKAGPYVYVDGRRDVFITLHEGITIERLPTRLDINIKGQAWPAYLSSGIRCSRCHGQGHRRAICPLLAGLANNTRMAPPTTPAGVPPPTTSAPPQRSAAQPPAPAPSNLAMEVCSAPPMARAVLHPSAPRPSPPAAPALPMEETPSAPPPVIPAPSLQVPKNPVDPRSATPRHPEPTPPARPDFAAPRGPPPIQETLGPAAPTQDVEMSIVEETIASSTSSAKNATRVDLDAFIEGLPSVSFAKTDALGLGREEVLDLLSSRTKAQRKGPPPVASAVRRPLKAELRTTPAVPPTPTLPAPWPAKPTPPALHGEKTSPDIATPPPPLSTEFIDACYDQANDIIYELSDERYLETLSDIGVTEGDIVEAIIFPDDREPLLRRLSTQKRTILAGIVSAASERARSSDPFYQAIIIKYQAMIIKYLVMVIMYQAMIIMYQAMIIMYQAMIIMYQAMIIMYQAMIIMYQAIIIMYQAMIIMYQAIIIMYQAMIIMYQAIIIMYQAMIIIYQAMIIIYQAMIIIYQAMIIIIVKIPLDPVWISWNKTEETFSEMGRPHDQDLEKYDIEDITTCRSDNQDHGLVSKTYVEKTRGTFSEMGEDPKTCRWRRIAVWTLQDAVVENPP
ncbi:hypothetical protein LAZ67_23002086 [Cordylochernes scorpioides]|uniref:Uncharacterized protein n=1 Tax=Cordylochernes scorpioides TaxID=51811 RepID=A0ABY6LT35_9ARAC|nr:hypothetical protein LAZ67_23002086 [Cordylochernes scorpioides]